MPLNSYDDLNDIQMDVLREIGNIGSGNAATALSSMVSRPINIKVPKINILDYEQVMSNLGGPEELMVGILLALSGEIDGMMMFLLHKDFAHMTVNDLLGCDLEDFNQIGEMEMSAIQEVGNIMAASYVNAMSQMIGLDINISVPDMCVDMVGAILSVPAIHFANISEKIILIEDEFDSTQNSASSHILMMPDVDSLNKIMQNLGIDI